MDPGGCCADLGGLKLLQRPQGGQGPPGNMVLAVCEQYKILFL